jgi:hypothetical protein
MVSEQEWEKDAHNDSTPTLTNSGTAEPRTTARVLEQSRPTMTVILIFYQAYVARLAPLEYQELLLTPEEEARQ